MKKKFLVVLLTMLLLTGCNNKPKLENSEYVVASMKDKNITADELYNALKSEYGTNVLINLVDEYITNKEYETTDEIKKAVEEQYNSQKEQNEEYYNVSFDEILKSYGYTEESFKKALTISYKQQLIVLDYIKDNLKEDEIKKYYDDNMYGKITARHILITPNKTENMTDKEIEASKKEAYNKAMDIIKKLDNKEDFSNLAKEYSSDTVTKDDGGLLEPFDNTSGFVESFYNAAKELEIGKYTKKPIETQYGYHIILKEKEDERPSYEDNKEKIKDILSKEKLNSDDSDELINKALVNIRNKYGLEIYDTTINDNYKDSIK